MIGWSTATAAAVAAVLLCAVVGVATVRRRYAVVTVSGRSMQPTLHDGDRVLVRRHRRRPPGRGEIVVLQSPSPDADWSSLPPPPSLDHGSWVIKRVVAAPRDPIPAAAAAACGRPAGSPVPAGQYLVFGDGPVSHDSRIWGFVPGDRLLGVVLRGLTSARSPAR